MGHGDARVPRTCRASWGGSVLDPLLSISGTRISALGASLPEQQVPNAVLEERFGLEPGWIADRTGITSRRVAAVDETVVSLAAGAALDACRNGGFEPTDIDTLIVATCTADDLLPPVAPRVASVIGAGRVAAVDAGAACAGSLWGLAHADALCASRSAGRVLVIGAEILSRMIADSDPKTAVLFGDGAGAIVVEAHDDPTRLGPFRMNSDGRGADLLWAPHDDRTIRMKGLEVYKWAVTEMAESARQAISDAGLRTDDVDLVVAHQANQRILSAVGERLGVDDDRMYSNIARYGNTSAASIPLALYDAAGEGRLQPGDRVLLVSFGAGFAWGAGLITWSLEHVPTQAPREAVHVGL